MEKFTHTQLLNLILLLFAILSIIYPPTLARPLKNTNHFITFFINDVLEHASPYSSPATENVSQLPFSETADLFHLNEGIPTADPNGHAPGFSSRPGASVGWLPFLTSVQALELGDVTVIEEALMGTLGSVEVGIRLKGKVQGIYVTSSENKNSRMVAMRAVFSSGKSEDSLRFFGEHRPGLSESHIAVVGGTGRYRGANGFAVVKATGQKVGDGRRKKKKKKLLFSVYIK